jgi:hypothetical protein
MILPILLSSQENRIVYEIQLDGEILTVMPREHGKYLAKERVLFEEARDMLLAKDLRISELENTISQFKGINMTLTEALADKSEESTLNLQLAQSFEKQAKKNERFARRGRRAKKWYFIAGAILGGVIVKSTTK